MSTSFRVIYGWVVGLLVMLAVMDGYALYLAIRETGGNPEISIPLSPQMMRLLYFTLATCGLFAFSAAVILIELWKKLRQELPKPNVLLQHTLA